MTYDVELVRKDFPILERRVHATTSKDGVTSDGVPLVYLDSAASSQKPRQVIDAMSDYYEHHHANVHRGVHTLAEEATALYEGARDKVARFINADRREVIFTKNSSEALNLVANVLGWAGETYGISRGDRVVITQMEHHSNIVPWQMTAARTGAELAWLGLTDGGRLDLSNLDEVVSERTKVVAVVHVSNILGTLNPIDAIVRRAHEVGALVVVDASQSAPHLPLDVRELGADFVAFTGHKMLGPTGIGVLWGRAELLEELPPFLGGGEMVETVSMETTTYAPIPHKYEAGTPPIAEAVGLGAAVDYLTALGMENVAAYEHELLSYAIDRLKQIEGLKIIGPDTAEDRGAAISFTLESPALGAIHPHDVGQVLDEQGIAVRVGQHCARPVCVRYGVPATTRASFSVYNTKADVDALVEGLEYVKRFFGA